MSSTKKAALVAVTIVVLVVAFVALRPTVDEEGSTATTPTTAEAPAAQSAPEQAAPEDAATEPEPEFERVRVRGGEPLDGVQDVTVTRGERVRLEFFSPDTSDEIHIHGYDRYVDLEAGEPVRDSFEADAEGIFEIELHGSATPIASLTVEAR